MTFKTYSIDKHGKRTEKLISMVEINPDKVKLIEKFSALYEGQELDESLVKNFCRIKQINYSEQITLKK